MKTTEAYDFSQFSPQREEQTRVRVVKTKKRTENRRRAFAVKGVLFLISVMILMAATVYSRLVLSETKSDINTSMARLTELQSENIYLGYQIENRVSLKNAENYAVNELGLVKLDSSRVEYVNLQSASRISVAGEDTDGFSARFNSFVEGVIEFFGG